VARFAEVGVAPAEPLGDRAAKFALKLDEIGTMIFAGFGASSDCDGGALAADKLFFLEVDVVLVGLIAILHASKVGLLTLEAHVVRKLAHGVFLQFPVESIFFEFTHSVVLMKILKLCSLQGFLDDGCLKFALLLDLLV